MIYLIRNCFFLFLFFSIEKNIRESSDNDTLGIDSSIDLLCFVKHGFGIWQFTDSNSWNRVLRFIAVRAKSLGEIDNARNSQFTD